MTVRKKSASSAAGTAPDADKSLDRISKSVSQIATKFEVTGLEVQENSDGRHVMRLLVFRRLAG